MNRAEIVEVCEAHILGTAARLFGATQDGLRKFADYEGCANLVYEYERGGRPLILRISFRPERPVKQIQADGISFIVVSFVKGRGMRVPDNEYRYRAGVPIDEYFQNWGRALGQMHALSKKYAPMSATIKRPEWFELDSFTQIDERVPESLPVVREKFKTLLGRLAALPKDRDSYGLIHRDFNDGNFTVDYDNGDMTIFDFDDACYFWFVYELACAWEGGIGRTMFRPLDKRQAFMDRYMEQLLEGYNRENSLNAEWLERLPLFLQVIQMEEFLHYAQYLDGPDDEIQAGLNYKRRCIEEDIPYLGFFR